MHGAPTSMVATYVGNQNIPMFNGHTQHPQCGDFIAQVQCMRIFTTVDSGNIYEKGMLLGVQSLYRIGKQREGCQSESSFLSAI